jgi:hypothetical protein
VMRSSTTSASDMCPSYMANFPIIRQIGKFVRHLHLNLPRARRRAVSRSRAPSLADGERVVRGAVVRPDRVSYQVVAPPPGQVR